MSDNSKPTKLGVLLLALSSLANTYEGGQAISVQESHDSYYSKPWKGDNRYYDDNKKGGYQNKYHYGYKKEGKSQQKNWKSWGHRPPNYFYPTRTPTIYPKTTGYGYDPRTGTGGAIYWGFYGNQIVSGSYPPPVPRVYQPAQLVPVGQLAKTSVSSSVVYNPYQPDPTRVALPLYEDKTPTDWVPDLRTAVPVQEKVDDQKPQLTLQKLTITPFERSQNQVFVVKQATQPTAIVSNNSKFKVQDDSSNDGKSSSAQVDTNSVNSGNGVSISNSASTKNININLVIQQSQQQSKKPLFVPISSVLASSGNQWKATSETPAAPATPATPVAPAKPATSFTPNKPNQPTENQQNSYVPPASNIPPPETSFTPQNKSPEPQQTTYVPQVPQTATSYVPKDESSEKKQPSNDSGYLPIAPPVEKKYPSNDSGYLPSTTKNEPKVVYNLKGKYAQDISTGSPNPRH